MFCASLQALLVAASNAAEAAAADSNLNKKYMLSIFLLPLLSRLMRVFLALLATVWGERKTKPTEDISISCEARESRQLPLQSCNVAEPDTYRVHRAKRSACTVTSR